MSSDKTCAARLDSARGWVCGGGLILVGTVRICHPKAAWPLALTLETRPGLSHPMGNTGLDRLAVPECENPKKNAVHQTPDREHVASASLDVKEKESILAVIVHVARVTQKLFLVLGKGGKFSPEK